MWVIRKIENSKFIREVFDDKTFKHIFNEIGMEISGEEREIYRG
jgi:hypothetical protein